MSRPAWFLLVLGLAQMVGDLLGLGALRGLALATAASPAPKVFCSRDGLETFSSTFRIEWIDAQGREQLLLFQPETAQRLEGPYNRRNVYGAVVAYGPVFAQDPHLREVCQQVVQYALGDGHRLLNELGVETRGIHSVRVCIDPRPGTPWGGRSLSLEVPRS